MGATKSKILAVAVASALPLGLTGPAEASHRHHGCVVTPLKPANTGHEDASNRPLVRFTVKIDCEPNRQVRIRQNLYEMDSTGPQKIGTYGWVYNTGSKHFTRDQKTVQAITYTDSDNTEELFHTTYFYVVSNGVTGTDSPTRTSPILVLQH